MIEKEAIQAEELLLSLIVIFLKRFTATDLNKVKLPRKIISVLLVFKCYT